MNLQSRRPYPAFGRIRMWVTDGESDYHSLQSEFKQRGPWGLNLTAAYTLSELNDNQQGGLNASRGRRQNPAQPRRRVRGRRPTISATGWWSATSGTFRSATA